MAPFTTRLYHSCCIVNNILWIYGGITSNKSPKYYSDIWTYGLTTGVWNKVIFTNSKPSFEPEPLAFHTMTPIFSKKILNSDGIFDSYTACKYEKLNV